MRRSDALVEKTTFCGDCSNVALEYAQSERQEETREKEVQSQHISSRCHALLGKRLKVRPKRSVNRLGVEPEH